MDQKVINHFKKTDPILYKLIQKIKPVEKRSKIKSELYFHELVESIVSQQLSIKAADTIFNRILNKLPDQKLTPENILILKDEELRNCGLSWSKVSFVKDLAQKVINHEVHLDKLDEMADDQIMSELTKIKGIGPWTVEMFLMFTLQREDIFSYGDLGLKNAIKKIYGLENPTKIEIEKIIQNWSPYRAWGCRVLWKSLEKKD